MTFKWISRDRWEKSKKPTPDEMRIIQRILKGSDLRLSKLLKQVETAPYVERELVGSGYKMKVPWTTDDLLIPMDEDIQSSPSRIIEAGTGRLLTFRLHLLRGGFFGHLMGFAEDGGDWPKNWNIGEVKNGGGEAALLTLPHPQNDPTVLAQLSAWIEEPITSTQKVVLFPSANQKQMEDLADREGIELPEHYKKLVSITNGLDIGTIQLLGTKDAYWLEDPSGKPLLVISQLEDGVIALVADQSQNNEVLLCEPVRRKERMKTSVVARNLRDFVVELLHKNRE